jgi:hypothetical protein
MTSTDPRLLDKLQARAASAVAIEALWDGDTQGWFVDLYAAVKGPSGYESQFLQGFRRGGDIRLLNGEVPPWPESLEAARLGEQLAQLLSVPFHFPSPNHPETDCPHWWELSQSHPCERCGIQLLQAPDCPWRGACYYCHLAREREAREARWSPEERAAPRCSICGNPALGEIGSSARCSSCRETYRTFACSGCGILVTVHRERSSADTCSTCAMAKRLSALSVSERQRLREAVTRGTLTGLIEAREILQCGLTDAQDALEALSRAPDEEG